jgi:hypothetical protein
MKPDLQTRNTAGQAKTVKKKKKKLRISCLNFKELSAGMQFPPRF